MVLIFGVSNLDGSEYRRLTRSRGYQYGPKWSPDGSQIAFISCPRVRKDAVEGTTTINPALYTMAANGSGPTETC